MSDPKFKVGDVVKLNGSDYNITIRKVASQHFRANGDNHTYYCQWIDVYGKPQEGMYIEPILISIG